MLTSPKWYRTGAAPSQSHDSAAASTPAAVVTTTVVTTKENEIVADTAADTSGDSLVCMPLH